MDRSLDEIIAERPKQSSNRSRHSQPVPPPRRRGDGVKKPYRDERVDLDLDWVHDKYEDDRDSRPHRNQRRGRSDRYSPSPEHSSAGARIRVENLHYDITESDLEELFNRIGPISSLSLRYDRAGRSEGVAFVTYNRLSDARTAIAEFDGANAKGQPIRMSLSSSDSTVRRDRNPFDNVKRPKGSLFDRIERPRDRDERSLSPGDDSDSAARRRNGRRGGTAGGRSTRRSDVSKPAPENIDRYIPGERSAMRRTGGGDGGRGPGRRGGDRRGGGEDRSKGDSSRRTANARPKKTQEELDQEMEDYWGNSAAGANAGDAAVVPVEPAQPQVQAAPAVAAAATNGDDDVDMIE